MAMPFYPGLNTYIRVVLAAPPPESRRAILQALIDYLRKKQENGEALALHFICTHNSRRSQFAQVWAQSAASFYGQEVRCTSGGTAVTAFNERAVAALERAGFRVKAEEEEENPTYWLSPGPESPSIKAFSKLYDAPGQPEKGFAAVMTCAQADENCPFVPGAERRIPLLYDDPKAFDHTSGETAQYDTRCLQIAREMFFVFAQLTLLNDT